MKMVAVISKIISMQSNLTVSENEIAQYVMNHAEEVVTSTITNVAKNTNTSEASINRFCKKVGFKGFNSFKISLAQENFFNSMKEQDTADEPQGVVSSVSRDYRQMIVNTSAMLDESALTEAVSAIKKARCIYVFAYASTAFVAYELELKLQMVGISVKVIVNPSMMRVYASTIQKGDLAVAIVPTLMMRDIYQAVATCKDLGAEVLTITSYDSPKLDDLVDYKFITSDRISARNALSLSNSLMYLFVADVIYGALLENDKTLRQKKLNSDALMSGNQLIDNYMLEY